MKKDAFLHANEKLKQIHNAKLGSITRAGSMADFGFGDLIEKKTRAFDENRQIIIQKTTVPKFALHIDGRFRLSLGDAIILAKDDMFEPSDASLANPDFNMEHFDWDSQGNNRYDVVCATLRDHDLHDFVALSTHVNRLGDLKIQFSNGFCLKPL